MEKSKLSREHKDLLKEAIDNQYNYLTQEEVDSLKAYVYDTELAREVSMDWFPSSFASKINRTIIDILKQAVWDLHEYIKKNIAIKEMKEEFDDHYDIINQNSFKGLMREL